MLFNSYLFIFLFLPITLIIFFTIGKRGHHRVAISWLVAASLFFYGWWNPKYLGLMLGSILFNYATGVVLGNHEQKIAKVWILAFGVSVNLILIGFFKYANFFVNELSWALKANYHFETIILPLAISFFTFQQIAYLVDSYKGKTHEYNFLRYCLFVTFFPQLIAGPIVHHKEMLPQFAKDNIYRINYEHIAVGMTIFAFGLFKKVVFADSIAEYATPVFNAAESGVALTFFEAWCGALAYTLQLYFDFSGYSDMAIGLARLFGVRLPLNFHSPYKAKNIIEFWRCWHMTLSRFLKDYIYIPLGGNRKGRTRRYINLMITMLLGGLWHGAGWTFVVWGGVHGVYLIINHVWHVICRALGLDSKDSTRLTRGSGQLITFVAVVVGWVLFRAESIDGALRVLSAMIGGNGISLPVFLAGKLGRLEPWLFTHGFFFDGMYFNGLVANWKIGWGMITILLLITWFAPNTQQVMIHYRPAFEIYRGNIKQWRNDWLQWKPTLMYAVVTIMIFSIALFMLLSMESEFLYFNF